jgi:hypothetical protein
MNPPIDIIPLQRIDIDEALSVVRQACEQHQTPMPNHMLLQHALYTIAVTLWEAQNPGELIGRAAGGRVALDEVTLNGQVPAEVDVS